ncbi:MAG: Flp pilus assembly complex ATPase component TadA, partial [Candidatus Omnitrophica bacterium]|nr:Flp pilus assembly complex ATPase component TadA [Candidatus Omnitrophota bacterium]
MAEDPKETRSQELTGDEEAAPLNGGKGAEKDPQIDDLMEAAGFLNETSSSETDEEAAQPYTEDMSYAEGYTVDDQIEIQRSLADRLGIDYVDIAEVRPTDEILKILPKRTVTRFKIFPVEKTDSSLKVAFSDPYNVMAMQDVELILEGQGLTMEMCLGNEADIARAIDHWYTAERNQIAAMIDQVSDTVVVQEQEKKKKDAKTATQITPTADEDVNALAESIEDEDIDAEAAPLVRLVNLILLKALKMRASDIHFEPYPDEFRIRFRVDGVLHDIDSPPQKLQTAMITRLKIMAKLDLAEKRVPQDGRIQMRLDGKDIDFRVSSLPAIWGESIVLRILDKTGLLLGLEQVGFMPDNVALFKKLIKRPNGIILMTGPTGSGKTTTLYAALNAINTVDTKIITVEHPVEYIIEGINQVQVDEHIGLSFGLVLRTMLRQAPNVILVGEMRDLETAETGIRAALTGHLVFSTLHTNDAPGATTRLVEMGIKPYLVSSALQAVIAQRLIRKICPDCKEMYYPPPAHIEEFGMDPEDFRGQPFYQGIGCHACNFTGYRGRTAIHEIMVMSEDLRALVLKSASAEK